MSLQAIVACSDRKEGKTNYSCPVSGWDECEAVGPETSSDTWEGRSQRSKDVFVSLSLQTHKTDKSWGLDFRTLTRCRPQCFSSSWLSFMRTFCLPLCLATWQESCALWRVWRKELLKGKSWKSYFHWNEQWVWLCCRQCQDLPGQQKEGKFFSHSNGFLQDAVRKEVRMQ